MPGHVNWQEPLTQAPHDVRERAFAFVEKVKAYDVFFNSIPTMCRERDSQSYTIKHFATDESRDAHYLSR